MNGRRIKNTRKHLFHKLKGKCEKCNCDMILSDLSPGKRPQNSCTLVHIYANDNPRRKIVVKGEKRFFLYCDLCTKEHSKQVNIETIARNRKKKNQDIFINFFLSQKNIHDLLKHCIEEKNKGIFDRMFLIQWVITHAHEKDNLYKLGKLGCKHLIDKLYIVAEELLNEAVDKTGEEIQNIQESLTKIIHHFIIVPVEKDSEN